MLIAYRLEEGGVLTDCTIRTIESSPGLDIDLRATEIPTNIIMKTQWLAEVSVE